MTCATRRPCTLTTEVDPRTGALCARNAYSLEFSGQVAFFDTDESVRSLTGDRTEFIGRNGSLRSPAGLARERLSGRVGAGLDPCAAIQIGVELGVGQTREVVFRLGVGPSAEAAGSPGPAFSWPRRRLAGPARRSTPTGATPLPRSGSKPPIRR